MNFLKGFARVTEPFNDSQSYPITELLISIKNFILFRNILQVNRPNTCIVRHKKILRQLLFATLNGQEIRLSEKRGFTNSSICYPITFETKHIPKLFYRLRLWRYRGSFFISGILLNIKEDFFLHSFLVPEMLM